MQEEIKKQEKTVNECLRSILLDHINNRKTDMIEELFKTYLISMDDGSRTDGLTTFDFYVFKNDLQELFRIAKKEYDVLSAK